MKLILYFIVVCSFVMLQKANAYFGDRRYTLLQPPDDTETRLINDSYTGGLLSYEFTSGNPVIVKPEDVGDLLGETLSSPFIVTAIFKSYDGTSSCPFSIMQDKTIVLSVCVEPTGEDSTRVIVKTLLYEPKEIIKYKFNQDFTNKWIKLLVYVKDDNAELYINCSKEHVFESLKKMSDIRVTEDMHIKIAHSFSAKYRFKGVIEEISLYTQASDDTKDLICRKPRTTTTQSLGDPETVPPPTTPEPIIAEKGEKGERGLKGEAGEAGIKGIKGEKGDKGDTGKKGDLGHEGPIGPIGPIGKRGEQGACECSEKLVSSLLLSMPEMRGPPGELGPPGNDGDVGPTGATGNIGPQGERGPQGLKGETGARGDDGLRGRDGAIGPKGEPGKDGISGSPGVQGPKGEQGPPGPIREETEEEKNARIIKIPGEKGAQGPIGPPGTPGEKGVPGDIGPKGEVGPIGEKGDKGRTGLQGPRGEKGDRGEAGTDGLPGTPGTHGRPANKAEKGDRGDKGVPGLAGLPASLTSVLDAKNAEVVEKLRGFKGERGETGEKGDKGDQGSIGKEGPHGNDGKDGLPGPKGEVGPKGSHGHKGDRGEPGPAGKVPASEIALLKGAKGDRGQLGLRGEPGPTGSTGKKGDIGPFGPEGQKGDTGPSGPMGPIGSPGYNGTVGEKGQKGDSAPKINVNKLKGDKGDRGLPGDPGKLGGTGPQGPPGTCVETSTRAPVVGAPGPPGPPGVPGVAFMGQKGEKGETIIQKMDHKITSWPDYPGDVDDDDFYTLNTVVYRTKRSLIQRTEKIQLGTLAYVLQEEKLLLRVENGWKYVVMGSLMDAMPPSTTHIPPTTTTFRAPTSLTMRPQQIKSPPKHRVLPKTRGFIRMVALNEPYHGKISIGKKDGREGADQLCYDQGKVFKLGGTFRAFLATSKQDLIVIVTRGERDLPVVNLNGSLLFKSWKSIFNGSGAEFVSKPATIFSFNGKSVMIDPNWPNKTVWYGGHTDHNGSAYKGENCNDWKSGSKYFQGVGSSLESNRLLNQEFYNCDNKFIVLCVEVAAYRGHIPTRRKRHHRRHNLLLN